ncbi:COG0488: ATPase components of ABC transporters with duplicated ATPase domains [hydrothermal vent metagenome]|uniref:COG0488: ATPase components of ABC transporters with duplicated ATPase domains n=1 Tax=hydrothermal vent metagenome TaxID=652676 RepID=A0A3B1DUH6_9ZZZZ
MFLNEVTNYTILLEGAKMTKVKGNYAMYEQQRDISLKSMERRQKVVEKKRQQLERFTQRFHAQPNLASAVRNKRKMIDKLEKFDTPQDSKSMGEFQFSDIPSSGYVVAQAEGISKSYDDKQVYKDLNFEIIRGQKICFVGPNGAGKSTLLKMLAKVLEQDSGTIKYGHNVETGYFSQSRLDVLNPNRNAFEEVISSGAAGTPALKARSLLGLFNFRGDDVFKPVTVLSGGEKSRLILAKLLVNPPNFMLLDEPTTHLDLDGVRALTNAFKAYPGTLCFISHDLYFIREIADHIVEVADGTIRMYPGGLQYYLDKKAGRDAVEKEQKKQLKEEGKRLKKAKGKGGSSKSSASGGNTHLNNIHEQHNKALKRVTQIKKEIKALEKEKKALDMESYVKSRHLSKDFDKRDSGTLKEYGQRLKWIQSRLREVESTIKQLTEEKNRISK